MSFLLPFLVFLFAVSAFISAGGPSAILRDRRERKAMFAREAEREAELREWRRAKRDAS